MSGGGGRVALVYGVLGDAGGLAVQSANALAGMACGSRPVVAVGPAVAGGWPRSTPAPEVEWRAAPEPVGRWRRRLLARRPGTLQEVRDRRLGRWAAHELEAIRPSAVYAFTQVALESVRWAQERGVPGVLETPNGHLAAFRRVYLEEAAKWCGGRYRGHPTPAMVARVEEEYARAAAIRVSSAWTKASLVAGGVPEGKIAVLEQPVDLERYRPPEEGREPATGPLRLCFVGSLDLRKGFVYLLRAMKRAGPERFRLRIVGATGDPCSRRLFAAERRGLAVEAAPGDPRPVYAASELAVLPTLEDGSPFAAAEAMASGLPLITTSSCGAGGWVRPGATGWQVPPADVEALAAALDEAHRRRADLPAMGAAARADTERRAGPHADTELGKWFDSIEAGRLRE